MYSYYQDGGKGSNAWTRFLQANKDKGHSMREMSILYRKTHTVRSGGSHAPSPCVGLEQNGCLPPDCKWRTRRPKTRAHCRTTHILRGSKSKRRSTASKSNAPKRTYRKKTAAQKAAGHRRLEAARVAARAASKQRGRDAAERYRPAEVAA